MEDRSTGGGCPCSSDTRSARHPFKRRQQQQQWSGGGTASLPACRPRDVCGTSSGACPRARALKANAYTSTPSTLLKSMSRRCYEHTAHEHASSLPLSVTRAAGWLAPTSLCGCRALTQCWAGVRASMARLRHLVALLSVALSIGKKHTLHSAQAQQSTAPSPMRYRALVSGVCVCAGARACCWPFIAHYGPAARSARRPLRAGSAWQQCPSVAVPLRPSNAQHKVGRRCTRE